MSFKTLLLVTWNNEKNNVILLPQNDVRIKVCGQSFSWPVYTERKIKAAGSKEK